MSLPLCPVCGEPNPPRIDSAAEIRLAPYGSPANYTIAVHRGYRCRCGWTCWTTETITAWRPSTPYVRRKFAVDETADVPDPVQTP